MPHILWELQGEQFYDKTSNSLILQKKGLLNPEEYDQFIGDITNFMVFVSEPNQQKRKQIGYYVLGFLFLLLVLAVNLKREFWKDIK
jgi:ubiquinol-cytochrome c reductase cytochrome c1 subunit